MMTTLRPAGPIVQRILTEPAYRDALARHPSARGVWSMIVDWLKDHLHFGRALSPSRAQLHGLRTSAIVVTCVLALSAVVVILTVLLGVVRRRRAKNKLVKHETRMTAVIDAALSVRRGEELAAEHAYADAVAQLFHAATLLCAERGVTALAPSSTIDEYRRRIETVREDLVAPFTALSSLATAATFSATPIRDADWLAARGAYAVLHEGLRGR